MGCLSGTEAKDPNSLDDVVVGRPIQVGSSGLVPVDDSRSSEESIGRPVAKDKQKAIVRENSNASLASAKTAAECFGAQGILSALAKDDPREEVDCSQYRNAQRLEMASPVEGDVVLTGRSLFLNQNIAYFDGALGTTDWNMGTYTADLHLTPDDIANLRGKRVLDLAGGAGLFPEEALAFGAEVDVIDLNKEVYDRLLAQEPNAKDSSFTISGFRNRAEFIRYLYVRNLEIIYCQNQQENFLGDYERVFNHLFRNRVGTGRELYSGRCSRVPGDATDLSAIKDDTYDMLLNCWMLNYLTDEQRLATVSGAVRITKVNGEIRLEGGHEDADGSKKTDLSAGAEKFPSVDARRLEDWAGKGLIGKDGDDYIIGGKRVRIGEASKDSFLLLHVVGRA